MLGIPENGWVRFQPDKEEYWLSYLSDIPNQWLDRAIFGLESGLEFHVEGHCEPGILRYTVSSRSCSCVLDGEVPREIPVDMGQFCWELHRDIAQNLDAWAKWESIRWDLTEKEKEAIYAARKGAITAKLNRLKDLLNKKTSCRK